ncbi:MAG: hypothetical protein M0D57_17995 [Sphingobacteriales bacterium JAD_PAG50586_3]|nr:MAG: hypothetical protein M0D57_17995 [Sphingobacteriales bacterium JAD_PAG50586_3]
MPTKLLLLLLAFIISTIAIAQTPCDSVYIKVAGMKPTQFGVARISLTKDLSTANKKVIC